MNLTKLALEIVQYNPFVLPLNDCNKPNSYTFKLRALFKLMLYSHLTINFPRHFDPDLGQYKIASGHKEYLPLEYDPKEILQYKVGNCGTYSTLFEALAEAIGFNIRHIGIQAPDKINSHWCSEVKIENKWAFFDAMYLICPIDENWIGIPTYKIVKNPYYYITTIPPLLRGISIETWLNLWKGLEIDGISSHDIGMEKFIKKFY